MPSLIDSLTSQIAALNSQLDTVRTAIIAAQNANSDYTALGAQFTALQSQIVTLQLEQNALSAEAAELLTHLATDNAANSTRETALKAAWEAFGTEIGACAAHTRDAGHRAARYKEITGLTTYQTPQLDLRNSAQYQTWRDEVRTALETSAYSGGGSVEMLTVAVPIWITA